MGEGKSWDTPIMYVRGLGGAEMAGMMRLEPFPEKVGEEV